MKLLAIDCSTEACSVALLDDTKQVDGGLIGESFELAPREHTQRLLPMVDHLLAQTETSLRQLDAIAFGCGPGSFTGLRICIGAVQGLAFGADLPVIPVSTLTALAQTGLSSENVSGGDPTVASMRVLSALDARMDEIYWGIHCVVNGLVVLEGEEQLSAPEQLTLPESCSDSHWIAVGSGWNYAERIACASEISIIDNQLLPRASAVAVLAQRKYQLGHLLQADEAVPTYLRDDVAWKKQT
ncbi:MAG: tRNA (adenosine(37)-N6)-threonylcarbamoyltransferase complex dimerization subunit type 1 TsaB [Pseudomonadales bacterium]